MPETDVILSVGDQSMRTFQATPAGTPTIAVIVIPEAFGLNGHIEDVTRRFADAGMVGLGLDIFHRAGGGIAPYTDFKQAMALFEGLDDEGLGADLDAAIAHLNASGFATGSIAIVGFCFGGRVSLLAGIRHPLGAAASYYGGGIVGQGAFKAFPPLIDQVPGLQTPWIGFFGDKDRSIPVDDVEQLRSALAEQVPSLPTEIVRYADADHGFHCNERPAYNEEASADAWGRMIAFFQQHAG
jgi:carboxymethylenebutenolidase